MVNLSRRSLALGGKVGLVFAGLLSACGGDTTLPVSGAATVASTMSAPTKSPTTTATTTYVVPQAQNLPPGGISYSALDYVVIYIETGYCTPNDMSEGCQVAEISDQSVAGPLAPGAYRVVGYDLCSWVASGSSGCNRTIQEAPLVAQAFSIPAAAHTYLEEQSGTGQWGMGWQCNQWAVLIGNLPGDDQSKVQRSLSSAATILNGLRNADGSAPYQISEVF